MYWTTSALRHGLADRPASFAARFLEIQQDLSNQRRQAKDAEKARIAAEVREAELNDQLEMITLDKEMAEEKTETLESHIAQLEEQVEGMKIEVEVLQEENGKS